MRSGFAARGGKPRPAGERVNILTVHEQQRDGPVHRHMLGALGDQDLAELAVIDGFHLHGRLVGLDLGDDVAGAHRIALAHQPFDELPLLHGGRERRHENFGWHQS